jgi:hypothetical protein
MKVRGLLIVAGAAISLGFAVVACGGGGGSLSLDEYFQKVDALDQESADRTDELDRDFESAEDVDEARDLIAELIAVSDDFRDGLAGLDAPDEAADAQAKALEGFDAFIAELTAALEDAGDATTVDDLYEALLSIDEAGINQATEACLELEEIASENGIDVDLDCGEEDEGTDSTPEASAALEAYFAELDAAEDAYRASNNAVGDGLNALDDSTAGQAGDLMAQGQAGIDEFVATLEGMDPPDEVAVAHAETVAGFQAASAWIGENLDAISNAATVDEVTAMFSSAEFTEISAGLDGTCDALQAIADGHGITVDLSCGG